MSTQPASSSRLLLSFMIVSGSGITAEYDDHRCCHQTRNAIKKAKALSNDDSLEEQLAARKVLCPVFALPTLEESKNTNLFASVTLMKAERTTTATDKLFQSAKLMEDEDTTTAMTVIPPIKKRWGLRRVAHCTGGH